jgi:hypothetical protein
VLLAAMVSRGVDSARSLVGVPLICSADLCAKIPPTSDKLQIGYTLRGTHVGAPRPPRGSGFFYSSTPRGRRPAATVYRYFLKIYIPVIRKNLRILNQVF